MSVCAYVHSCVRACVCLPVRLSIRAYADGCARCQVLLHGSLVVANAAKPVTLRQVFTAVLECESLQPVGKLYMHICARLMYIRT